MRVLGLTLGDWRSHSTKSASLFSRLEMDNTPGVYLLSARASGFKGAFSGARHSWISACDGTNWISVEITDEETLAFQSANDGKEIACTRYGSPSPKNKFRSIFRSNRIPDGYWFGQAPKLELSFHSNYLVNNFLSNLDYFCSEYPFQDSYTLIDNNCSKFISYLLWRSNVPGEMRKLHARKINLIGFKDEAYWQSLEEFGNEFVQAS